MCAVDHSVFIRLDCTCNELTLVGLNVDDMLIIASNDHALKSTKAMLNKFLDIKDLRPAEWLLGI